MRVVSGKTVGVVKKKSLIASECAVIGKVPVLNIIVQGAVLQPGWTAKGGGGKGFIGHMVGIVEVQVS